MSRMIACRRLEFAYDRFGDAADPTIVLIRGLGTQMIEWGDEFIAALVAAGLQVLIFDNRDVGESSKLNEQYALTDMAGDVVGIMAALDIGQAHIFGISLGGMVAQLVGYLYPEKVLCLFSVMSSSGNPQLPAISAQTRARLLETAADRESIIRLNADNRQAFGSPGYPESGQQRLATATRAYDRCYCPAGVARQMQAVIDDGSRVARLQKIRVPTLVIHGADDPLIDCAAGADTAQQVPDSEFVAVPGMGHNIPAALVPTIAGLVADFITRRT